MEGFEFRNPYAAPAAQVPVAPVGRDETEELVLAGRLPRLLAQLADGAVYFVALLPAFIAVAQHEVGQPASDSGVALMLLSLCALLAVTVIHLMLLYRHGQTLGKRWIGIRIVRSDGDRAGLPRLLFLRGFVPGLIGGIPYIGWVFALGNVLWIFGEERRCLHDHFADTIVVNA